MGIFQIIGRQAQHPSGFVGRFVARMVTRSSLPHAKWVAQVLDIQPTDNLVEVGFGSGASIQHFAELANQGLVAGADISGLHPLRKRKVLGRRGSSGSRVAG